MYSFKKKNADIDLIYKRANDLNLPIQVYLPEGDIHNARTVLLIHGGGWNDAIRDNSVWNGGWLGNNARYFSQMGFIAVTISYRSLLVSEELNVGDLLEDCIDAIKYVKEHLRFIDFSNIIYMGESAGGYLSTMLGLSQDDEIRPYATISLNPVLGLLDSKWRYGFNNCSDIDSLTPIKLIGEKCSEFLFMHGTADTVVEIEYTEELHNELIKQGHKSEFIKVPGASHAFALYDYKSSDEYATKIMDQIIQYIEKKF